MKSLRNVNKMILTLTPDVLVKTYFQNLKILKNFKDFTLLAPEYKNQKIYKTLHLLTMRDFQI